MATSLEERIAIAVIANSRARALVKARRESPPPEIPVIPGSALEWATQQATIVHPTRGTIPFTPYPYQARFLADTSPRRLVDKARQIGFSTVIALEAAHAAITRPDDTTLMISRNQDLARELLGYCSQAVAGLAGGPSVVTDNQSELAFSNGSRILALPANKSAGRGIAASRVYLDEFAYHMYPEEIYRSVSPTVSHGGSITVCSTPDGRGNLFFRLWDGLEGGEWSRHMFTWRDCLAYDDAWYARERPNYTAAQWESEYEASFVASGLAVFRGADIEACREGWLGLQEPRPGRRYVTGWDIGRRADATVGITLDATERPMQIVAFERHLGMPYPQIQARIDARAALYDNRPWVESNGVGDPVIENLTCKAEPFVTSAKSKNQAITALALALEQHDLVHDIDEITRELRSYQWADEKLIQDCVMSLAIAVVSASAPRRVWTAV